MIFDDETRARLTATVTTDFDPATATIEVAVDGVWYPATWLAAATVSGATWKRVAVTTGYFRGPNNAGAGVLLALGRHLTKTRVTTATDTIVADSSPVDVR